MNTSITVNTGDTRLDSLEEVTLKDTAEIIVSLQHPKASITTNCGGKGANLARLAQAGFRIPDARIVTTNVYQQWFETATITWPQQWALSDPQKLHAQCLSVRQQLGSHNFDDLTRRQLVNQLESLVAEHAVSVRSSATLEDLPGASFAGQHDTFLGVYGMDAVIDSVRRCYLSLWEDRALSYRYAQGFAPESASMAVVVQHMVAASCAGVAFTMHPVSGNNQQIVINSAFGLGETVVSGDGGIDQLVVCKKTRNVIEHHIGEKQRALVQSTNGTEHVPIADDQRNRLSLNPEQIMRLAKMSGRVERCFAFPQDIEWAFEDDELYVLQSRPVTHFPERWTRQESAERFPAPITPLTWDFTTPGFHESLEYSLELLGMPTFSGLWFERIDGYIYGNQTAVELYTSGQQIHFDSLLKLESRLPEFRQQFSWVQDLPANWQCKLDRYLLALGNLQSKSLAALDLTDLWSHVLDIEATGNDYFKPNIAISITQGLLYRTLQQLLNLLPDIDNAVVTIGALTSFCDTRTNIVNRELHQLCMLASQNQTLTSLLCSVNRRDLHESGQLANFPVFDQAFKRFIEDHGHREVDFDAFHPTWSGQPWVVLENLRLMLLQEIMAESSEEASTIHNSMERNPVTRDQTLRIKQQRAERELIKVVPESLRTFTTELVRLCRVYTGLDDLEHYHTTRLSVPFREAIIEIGKLLCERQIVICPEDVFFAHRKTLERYIDKADNGQELQQEIEQHRLQYAEQLATDPPFEPGLIEQTSGKYDELRGLPGSPGKAKGQICVVRSHEDFSRFEPGAILVARTTNPAWTPLFHVASAVVTESGGPLSHGAVTAREIGIPAVVGVRDLLQLLEEGARVEVNGTIGSISRQTL